MNPFVFNTTPSIVFEAGASRRLGEMAADAMKQQRLLVNNPREVGEADALAIFRAAF